MEICEVMSFRYGPVIRLTSLMMETRRMGCSQQEEGAVAHVFIVVVLSVCFGVKMFFIVQIRIKPHRSVTQSQNVNQNMTTSQVETIVCYVKLILTRSKIF